MLATCEGDVEKEREKYSTVAFTIEEDDLRLHGRSPSCVALLHLVDVCMYLWIVPCVSQM